MRDKFSTLLGIESEEESMVSMLLTQSVFLGIFIGGFDITSHSLFLSVFDEKMMARGYIVSAFAGIILLSLYSWLKKRVHFKSLAIINLITITTIVLLIWCALILSPAKWIVFILFIMLGPLNILVLLGFRETTEHFFTPDQGKRLFRLTESGLVTGIMLISFIIPALLSVNFQLLNILVVSASSVFLVIIIQVVTAKEHILIPCDEVYHPEIQEKTKSLLFVLKEDSYIRILFIFSVLSVLTTFFIQYSFMAVTREEYPFAENMAGFLGLFTGSMMVVILFVKLVAFKYFLHKYGLQTCLIIAPVLVLVITAITIAAGLFLGYTPVAAGGFVAFFILLAVSRLISKTLKDTVESPSFKVIYQSIDLNSGTEFQSGTGTRIGEMLVLFSGLILTGLGLFSFIKLIHFSLILFIIAVVWVFIAYRLFKEYRKSVIKATEKAAREDLVADSSIKPDTLKNRFSAYVAFRKDYFNLISGDYSVLNRVSTPWYFEKIIDYAYTKKDLSLLPVLRKTATDNGLDEKVRKHASEVAEILQKSASATGSDEKINDAIKILSGTRKPQTSEILRLLSDNSIESKRLAIYMIGKFGLSDLLSEVCECLSIPSLAVDAYEVLNKYRQDIEDELVRFYVVTSGNTKLSKTILRLLGQTCTKETIGFLFSRLWTNSRLLKEVSVKYLINCRFKPSLDEEKRLNQITSEVIGIITWNLAAKISLERDNDIFLLEKIDSEITRWNEFLFNILSVTYNPGSIASIRKNLEKGTMESVCYALEMTDIVVSDSIKAVLISVFDDVPYEEKLRNLFQFFPGEIPIRKKLLEDIINRDYNHISLWTKACTLRSIIKIDSDDMAESVIALLFSPEEIIQQEAANLIARSDSGLYMSVSERIPDQIKKHMDKIINGSTDNKDLIFEKVQFLSKNFPGIEEDELLSLASEMIYAKSFDTRSLSFQEGCIIWPLSGENEVHVTFEGKTEKLDRKYEERDNLSFYFLHLSAVEEYLFQYPENSAEILKYIDINEV